MYPSRLFQGLLCRKLSRDRDGLGRGKVEIGQRAEIERKKIERRTTQRKAKKVKYNVTS
jgi:hypothetical protein